MVFPCGGPVGAELLAGARGRRWAPGPQNQPRRRGKETPRHTGLIGGARTPRRSEVRRPVTGGAAAGLGPPQAPRWGACCRRPRWTVGASGSPAEL
ncbi:hypothetical protein NDU88_003629 [Pleurodeles waltl]|uniref:Uncharacterized protein n=1 Tax=Pleurodeles waltl TaxID=8319 RepID=A0AAV7UFR0_PLEWA|nr:hypothetical protein NDU88_003629 [Pleurodeles waltl]